MKKLLSIFVSISAAIAIAGCDTTECVDYVNPYIGSISHLLVPCYPTIGLPNDMMRVYPRRGDYTGECLDGFPMVVTSHRGHNSLILGITGDDTHGHIVPVRFDNEKVTPYSYDVDIDECETHVSFAPANQSAMYAVNSDKGTVNLVFHCGKGSVIQENGAVKGWQDLTATSKIYFYAETDCQADEVTAPDSRTVQLHFKKGDVTVRYGVSFISAEQAQNNLKRSISSYDIKALAKAGRDIWNETLGRIKVQGGTEEQKRVLYTSYYRTLERPVCLSEDGRYWSAYDNSVHEDGGIPFYTDDWIWDTFRAAHPMRILMDRDKEEAILASYLRMAQQTPDMWLPTFPGTTGDMRGMNCNHGIVTFLDAYVKGLDVDVKTAFKAADGALTEKTLIPWRAYHSTILDSFYWEHGYFPALAQGEEESVKEVWHEKRQPIPVTLGTSYDCWAAARLAEAAGDKERAAFFDSHACDYRNIFNPETRFFHPKDANGNFLPDVDYAFGGGQGGRDFFDENNGWVYRWEVQHNVSDLVRMMGGNDEFCKEMDRMFATPLGMSKFSFYAKYPDHTGNVGQFSMANEPSFHIPYLYNYAGAPWKTQKRIRQMLATWYRDDLMGVPGDEDGGGMTAFVVFSSLGFYPVTPGKPVYDIGSPLFEKSTMRLENGKAFTIIAKGASEENKYIQSATINGKVLNVPQISHEDIMAGGTLSLVMGPRPNKDWGK